MKTIRDEQVFFKDSGHVSPQGNVTFLGFGSDILQELAWRFCQDGYEYTGWQRHDKFVPRMHWDLAVCGIGVLDPIGRWSDLEDQDWEANFDSNFLLPLRLLRQIWKYRKPNAAVCFFSGAGVARPARTYSAYSASKIALMKMTELLDDEEPGVKFFILGPGMVRTKIQAQTIRAGLNADNFERVLQFMENGDPQHGDGTHPQKIYDCLRWCMAQPKSVIGGRNIYVPTDGWNGDELAKALERHPGLFKLRRNGDGQYDGAQITVEEISEAALRVLGAKAAA